MQQGSPWDRDRDREGRDWHPGAAGTPSAQRHPAAPRPPPRPPPRKAPHKAPHKHPTRHVPTPPQHPLAHPPQTGPAGRATGTPNARLLRHFGLWLDGCCGGTGAGATGRCGGPGRAGATRSRAGAAVRCDGRWDGPVRRGAGRCDAVLGRPGAAGAVRRASRGAAGRCDGRGGAAVRQAPRGGCDGRRAKATPRLGSFGFWLTAAKAMSPRPPPIDLSPNQKKNTVGYALCRREWSSAPARGHVCGLGGDPHLVGGWGLAGVDCPQASCECEDDCEEVWRVGHAEA